MTRRRDRNQCVWLLKNQSTGCKRAIAETARIIDAIFEEQEYIIVTSDREFADSNLKRSGRHRKSGRRLERSVTIAEHDRERSAEIRNGDREIGLPVFVEIS